jgi:hypothetical protein
MKNKNYEALHYAIFFPSPCDFFASRTKFTPWHPVLKHPQSVFFPSGDRYSFSTRALQYESHI